MNCTEKDVTESAPLIRALWVQPFLKYLNDRRAPVDLNLASDLPCPARFMHGVISRAIDVVGACGCEVGREVGRHAGIRALGGLGHRVASEPTLGDAIATAARFMSTVHGARTLELARNGSRARLSSRLDESLLAPTAWEDGFVASILIDLVRLAAGPDWSPETLRLQSRPPKHPGCGHGLDGAKVRYGNSATSIEFPAALLDRRPARLPAPARPGAVHAPLPDDFVGTVERVLEFLLRQDNADVDSLSAVLGTSRRTLQRRLLRRGETFSQILDRVRSGVARRLLRDPSVKVIDVAHEVGYSDPAHFARAFRRWTGVAPGAYRCSRFRGGPLSARARLPRRPGREAVRASAR